ncbi:MAG: integrase core domain-containing protein [Leptospira sp.]|nr:integrase core domain-containing protein [Leptospira sp.]
MNQSISHLFNLIFFLYFILTIKSYYFATIEILTLKCQLSSYKRRVKIIKTKPFERIRMMVLTFLNNKWENLICIVLPATVKKWHNEKFKTFWALLSKRKKGRPTISREIIDLIRRLAKENSIWGATKLHGLLLKLGFNISERTVSKYIPKRPTDPRLRLRWLEWLALHSDGMISKDFFSVISSDFRKIFKVLFYIHHENREIIHFDIEAHPNQEWVIQKMKTVLRKKRKIKYVLSDNDSMFGKKYTEFLKSKNILHKKTSVRSPWQNGIAERWVKTCREELLDHIIPLSEIHLRKRLEEYIEFYNTKRTHLALKKDTPIHSPIQEKPPDGEYELVSVPEVRGLYHSYFWKKAA